MHNLFVFGTLKRGFPLHHALNAASLRGKGRTLLRYPMVIAGSRHAPMMFNEPGIGCHVTGEIYQLDDVCLEELDKLESVDTPGNTRARLRVLPIGAELSVGAWAYFKARQLAAPIHTGYLESYEDFRSFVGPPKQPA